MNIHDMSAASHPANPYSIAADAIDRLLRMKRDDPMSPVGDVATRALRPIWDAGFSLGELEHLFREAAKATDHLLPGR